MVQKFNPATSLKRYIDYIFIYEKHPESNIERMTSCLEELTKKCNALFIQDFLNKKSC